MTMDDDRKNPSPTMKRLLRFLEAMSEEERRLLLRELEAKYAEKEKRSHFRRPVFIMVSYTVEDRQYTDFVQDLSMGGVFIETCIAVPAGQKVTMKFPVPGRQQGITIAGEVVRTSPQGIAVKFAKLGPEAEEAIRSMLDRI